MERGVGANCWKNKLQASDFLGVIIDEIVNITVTKKLIIHVNIKRDGKAQNLFLLTTMLYTQEQSAVYQ